MNLFAKIVVFFILVLSVGFAVSQMALYSKRVNFKQQAAEWEQKARQRKSDLEAAQAELQEKTQQYENKVSQLQGSIDDMKSEVQSQSLQITELEKDLSEQKARADRLSVATTKMEERIEEKEGVIATLEDKNDKLVQTTNEQAEKISNLDTQLADATDQIRNLQGVKQKQEKQIAQLEEKVQFYENMESRLAKRGIHLPAEDVKGVDGQVIKTDPEYDLVVINKGKEDGVKVNYPFTIYRDSEYIAQAIVTDVNKQVCVARIEKGMVAEGKQVAKGDEATTRMAGVLAPITMYEER